ncbi:phage tail-collar fiber domain-containing protein [Paenibacillus sp. 22594]|uniref:phage tail-collar fiber domain-containing protein n=1 Tax=Paenibacillus sp. 22594 TaxID=3453947 RepID=UPI003F86836B
MAVFGGLSLTNKGLVLQGKAQAGAQLNYTRIAVGDGSLSGQSIPAMNSLISQKKNLPITRLRTQPPNKAIVGAVLKNADVTTGFFWREVGLFAQDPDAGEILYAYANAGVTADYIPPGGGSDVIEKQFDCVVVVGTASNISAVIDDSLVFALKSELDAVAAVKVDKVAGKGLSANDYTNAEKNKLADITAGAGGPGSATDTVIGNRTIVDTTVPGDTGTLTGLLSGIANMIKQITGEATWRTVPGMTIAAIKIILDAATNAATASTLIKRDSAGRAKVAAPSAADDIAIKSTVDDAKTAAIAASIPLAQKGAAGGVAAHDANRNVVADGILLPGYSERRYTWTFENGTANQKIDFTLPFSEAISGYIEIEVTGTWAYAPVPGKLVKRLDIVADGAGVVNTQTGNYTEVTGGVSSQIVISNVWADAANSRYVITVESLIPAGNSFSALIRRHSPNSVTPFTMGVVYTGAASTLSVAVQTIPDNTTTQSGYLIQKHRFTTDNGRAIPLVTGSDLNYLQDTGIYDGYQLLNAPDNSASYYYVEVVGHSNGPESWRKQRATALTGTASTPVIYERVMQGAIWGAWKRVLTAGTVSGIGDIGNYITDANVLYDNGFYNVPAAWTGSPFAGEDGANQGYVNHLSWNNGSTYAMQTFMPINAAATSQKGLRYRRKINGVWEPQWSKIYGADDNDFELFKIRGFVTGNVNSYTEPGVYVFFATGGILTNGPTVGMDYGILKVFIGVNGYLEQEATAVTAPYAKSYRTRTETVWGPWKRILTDSDSVSFAPAVHEHSRLIATTTARDIRPSLTGKGQFAPYFVSRAGLNGAVSTDYSDMLVLNTYDDASGGKVNALVFDKSTMQIFHYQAAQTDPAWGPYNTLAYKEHVSKTRSNDVEFLVTTTAANTLVSAASFSSSANVTVKAYLRLTAAATVEITVWYQDAGGANTAYIVPSKYFDAAGSYCFVPLFLNVAGGSSMNVVTTCSGANVAHISVVIEEA